jgi:S1-C subfamily serine protease
LGLFKRNNLKAFLIFCLIVSFTLGNISVFADNALLKDLDKSSSYARQAISELLEKDILTGDNNGNFNPQDNITRTQMIAIIVRVLDLDMKNLPDNATFKDVPKSHWAFPYVEAAYRNGIITGTTQDTFGVDALCTREQMTAMFVRGLGITTKEIDAAYGTSKINKLADRNMLSGWSRSYVEFALSTGLMTGTSNTTFNPMEYAKREQAAIVTSRFLDNQILIKTSLSKDNELTIKEIAALEKSVLLINTYDKSGVAFAQGSGFCIAPGLFLTNYHVLEGASSYKINDNAGKEYEVQGIVKYDADLDLAIIKTKVLIGMTPLKIGSKGMVSKGDGIVAIGSPQGLQNSISEGIVSGLRSFDYGKVGNVDTIQITAAISQGSSGGPLFDMKGYVIGVTTAMSEDGTQKFAVAIDHAKSWIQELSPKAFKDIKTLSMAKAIDEYWESENEEIRKTIEKAYESLEKEDIEAYMSTIHKLSPSYKTIRETYGILFSVYDFDFNVQQVKIIDASMDTAEAEVSFTVKRTGKKETASMNGVGHYKLSAYDGEWKIYTAYEGLNLIEGSGKLTGADLVVESPEKAPPADLVMKTAPLAFKITDSVMHPTEPIMYATDILAKKVVAYNYETRTTVERSFSLPPESITFAGDEVYVALLKGQHDPYWWDKDQKGAVAILDSSTLSIKEQFDVNVDPFDIVVDREGYIYLTSGSGQHTDMKTYSRKTMQQVGSIWIDTESYALMHPTINRIYTINTKVTPRGMAAVNVSAGKLVVSDPQIPINWQYHGDYAMGTNFKISPDGKFIFNSLGNIFIATTNNVVGDLTYYDSLRKGFSDIAFDLGNNRFFTGTKDGTIYEYNYSTLKIVKTHKVQGEIIYLHYRDNKLAAFTKVGDKYYSETAMLN